MNPRSVDDTFKPTRTSKPISQNNQKIIPTMGSINGKYRRVLESHLGIKREGTGIIDMNVNAMMNERKILIGLR